MSEPFIRATDIHKTYRLGEIEVPALRGLNLELRRGEFTALVGASGSGKSTLLNLIGCLDEPDRGTVVIDGRDVSKLSDVEKSDTRNRHIGFIFQSFNLVPVLDVTENVELPLLLQGELSARDRKARVEQAVIVVRVLTYWNSKRLAAEVSRREIYPLSHHALDALLTELGTARPSTRREKGPAYERARPNELWHIDIKGPLLPAALARRLHQGLDRRPGRRPFALPDRPARAARPQVKPILGWLNDCFELCGLPLEVMSDNGSPFVVWMPGVLTLFGKTLEELRIRHIRTQVNSPWTNGKIEASGARRSRRSSTGTSSRRPRRPQMVSPATPLTATTIAFTANSTGTRLASATTARPSPPAASSARQPCSTCRAGCSS